jgi:ankyrin repeat protein
MQTVTSGSAGAEKGSKMLEYACANNIQGVMDLLSGGVPVDFTDGALRTALHWASAFGNEEIVKLLIDRGLSPVFSECAHMLTCFVSQACCTTYRSFLNPRLSLYAFYKACPARKDSQVLYHDDLRVRSYLIFSRHVVTARK